MTTLDQVNEQVAAANRLLTKLGLADGVLVSLGHASMRVPDAPDQFVVKGRGYAVDALPAMRPEDMVLCDMDAFKVGGPDGIVPCSEVKIHACIYRERPDVQAVVHVHPRFTVLASVLGLRLRPMCKEGYALVRDPLPVYPHMKVVHSDEEGRALAAALGDRPAVLMTGHGATTVGATLEDAVSRMMLLEEQARMNWYARCAFGADYPSIADELLDEAAAPAAHFWELPHFRDLVPQNPPHRDGLWNYYLNEVALG